MKVHEQRDLYARQMADAEGELQWMREHLASSKFHGELEDSINVRDVDAFILRVRAALTNENA